MGTTVMDVVREYFPDISEDEADHIVWGHTGFPGFWNIPTDGATPEECFRKQLQTYKDGGGRALSLCCDPEGASAAMRAARAEGKDDSNESVPNSSNDAAKEDDT